MLSKWLQTEPRCSILDEPTRGIDVGAKVEVHHLMDELAAQGMAIILISSDLPEVLAMSDRILVMREGRQMAILDAVRTTRRPSSRGPWARPTCSLSRGSRRRRCSRAARVTVAGRRYPVGRLSDGILRRVRPDQIRELVTVLVIVLLVAFFSTQIDNYLGARTFLRVSTEPPHRGGHGGRPGPGRPDAQHRPLGRLASRAGGLHARHPDRGSTTDLAPVRRRSLIGMALGALMGAINGVIVAYGRVPAIITTLGTLAIYRVVLIDLARRGP